MKNAKLLTLKALKSDLSGKLQFFFMGAVLIWVSLSNSSTRASTLEEALNSSLIQRAQDKWEQSAIKGDLDLSKDLNFGKFGYLAGEIGYKFKVQPALASGLHQRMDSYFIGASVGGAELIQLGVQGNIEVSYSKLHLSLKSAILKKPVSVNKFPFSAAKALQKLSPGEAARLEISTSAKVGAGFLGDLIQPNFVSLKAAYEKGNNLLVEVYRLKDNKFRVRFATHRITGFVTAGLTLKPYIDFGVLDKVLNGLLSCKPLDLKHSQGVGDLPLDTMVMDYELNLNDPNIQALYDQVFQAVALTQLRDQLTSLARQDDFTTGIWQAFHILENHYRSQGDTGENTRSLERKFKARMLSEQVLVDRDSACFKLWKLEGQEGHSVSSIRVYDSQDNTSDLLYLRSLNENSRSFIKKDLNASGQREFEMLFYAQRNIPQDAASVQVGQLIDFVLNYEQEERLLGPNEMRSLLADFNYQYGSYSAEINLNELLAVLQNSKNLKQKVRTWISPWELRKLQVRSFADYKFLLERYVYNHPVRSMIPTSVNLNPLDKIRRVSPYQADINFIATTLSQALNPATTTVNFYQQMRALRTNRMFRFISAGFLTSLFPNQVRNEAIQFSYALEQNGSVVYSFSSSNNQNTDHYKNISGLMDALQFRNFDLTTQIISKEATEDTDPNLGDPISLWPPQK